MKLVKQNSDEHFCYVHVATDFHWCRLELIILKFAFQDIHCVCSFRILRNRTFITLEIYFPYHSFHHTKDDLHSKVINHPRCLESNVSLVLWLPLKMECERVMMWSSIYVHPLVDNGIYYLVESGTKSDVRWHGVLVPIVLLMTLE